MEYQEWLAHFLEFVCNPLEVAHQKYIQPLAHLARYAHRQHGRDIMDWTDAEELAMNVLGLDENTADSDSIEQAIYDKWDVSFDQFHRIAECLEQFTIPAQAGISQKLFRGFVKDGVFLTKTAVVK